jgi:hypothetical protein
MQGRVLLTHRGSEFEDIYQLQLHLHEQSLKGRFFRKDCIFIKNDARAVDNKTSLSQALVPFVLVTII